PSDADRAEGMIKNNRVNFALGLGPDLLSVTHNRQFVPNDNNSQYLRFDTWVTRAKPGDGLTVYFNGKLIGVVSLDTVTAGFITHFFPRPDNALGDVGSFTFTLFNALGNPVQAHVLLDNVSFGILKLLPPVPGGDSQSDRTPL